MPSGGKREGSGRKPKYGEPTITVAFRIPQSKKEEVTDYIKNIIKNSETMTQKKATELGWTIFTLDGGRIKAVSPIGSALNDVSALTMKTVLKKIQAQYK